MKINRKKLESQIEEIIAFSCAEGEDVDLTTKKVMDSIEELLIAVEAK